MQLFHWRSEAISNYGSGDIIVMAPNIEVARNTARANFLAFLREDRSEMFIDAEVRIDSQSAYTRLTETLEADLSCEPIAILVTQETSAIFIQGSD